MRVRICGVIVVFIACASLTACGADGTEKACQSMKDVSFDSVVGPLYDGASESFQRLYDKIDNENGLSLDYYSDVQQMTDLCEKYGVKNAASSMIV